MSILIQAVNTAVETFQSWVDKTNLLINAVSTAAVTVEPIANGSVSTGNGYVNGIMAFTELAAAVIRPGNVQATGTLTITANTLTLGNSTVNTFANSIYIKTAQVEVGNTTVGFMANTSGIRLNGTFYTNITSTVLVSNSGAAIGTRSELNFISGDNVTIDLTDDAGNDRVDIEISATNPNNITAETITLGNSTVNSFINSTAANVTSYIGNAAAIVSRIYIGNSTVNTTANSTQINTARIWLSTEFQVGNSTAGVLANTTVLRLNGKNYANLDPYVMVQNTGTLVGTRPTINFISGTSTDVDVVDNSGDSRVDVTISINSAALALGVIGGANTQVQYNDEGAFNGSGSFTFNKLSNTVTLSNTLNAANVVTNILWLPYSRVDNLFVNTSTTSTVNIDSLPMTDHRSAEYLVSIKDNNANAYQIAKLLLIHDNGNAYVTEYGDLYTNTNIGVFSATQNATHAILQITNAGTNNTSIKMVRVLVNP
jgi:hypothetical protein